MRKEITNIKTIGSIHRPERHPFSNSPPPDSKRKVVLSFNTFREEQISKRKSDGVFHQGGNGKKTQIHELRGSVSPAKENPPTNPVRKNNEVKSWKQQPVKSVGYFVDVCLGGAICLMEKIEPAVNRTSDFFERYKKTPKNDVRDPVRTRKPKSLRTATATALITSGALYGCVSPQVEADESADNKKPDPFTIIYDGNLSAPTKQLTSEGDDDQKTYDRVIVTSLPSEPIDTGEPTKVSTKIPSPNPTEVNKKSTPTPEPTETPQATPTMTVEVENTITPTIDQPQPPQDNKNDQPTITPKRVDIGVPTDQQNYSLSCELSAAGMILEKFLGAPPENFKCWEDYLVHNVPKDCNPHLGFVGDIDGKMSTSCDASAGLGYGTYAEVVAKLINTIGIETETGISASVSYSEGEEGYDKLVQELDKGNPIIVWMIGPVGMDSQPIYTIDERTGKQYVKHLGQHVLVVNGYEINENGSREFIVNDPWGAAQYNIARIPKWEVFNQMAVVVNKPIKPDENMK